MASTAGMLESWSGAGVSLVTEVLVLV